LLGLIKRQNLKNQIQHFNTFLQVSEILKYKVRNHFGCRYIVYEFNILHIRWNSLLGFGIARLFLFNKAPGEQVPSWLRFHEMKGLKVLLWETILVTLVIDASRFYCLQLP